MSETLTAFCPALMSPTLDIMSLISTPSAANERHRGGVTAQLGPGSADSALAANSHPTILNGSRESSPLHYTVFVQSQPASFI